MIPLAPRLDFDALLAIARSRLPGLAPQWTDYNYHDPGITLIELLAWIADSQIYSLGRNRLDERLAMARLLGRPARGAVPAAGMLFPRPAGEGAYRIEAGTRLTPASACAPRLESVRAVTILPLELASVTTVSSAGTVDHTSANARARASFAPFGEPPAADVALHIVLRKPQAAPPVAIRGPILLSIGFEMKGGDSIGAASLGEIEAFYGSFETRLDRKLDTSREMQRSGAMVFRLPRARRDADSHEIILRPRAPTALMPRVLRIAPNALPVVQRASFRVGQFRGTGRGGQKIAIEPASLFESDEVGEGRIWRMIEPRRKSARVWVGNGPALQRWREHDFEQSGPKSRHFSLSERTDGSRIEIGFGNGVNGRNPPLDEPMEVALQLSCGRGGNVETSLEWLLAGRRTRWVNSGPIGGGRDSEDDGAALSAVREMLASQRVLATSRQILDAVARLPESYGVERAWVEEGWEAGRRRPAAPATRTLLVVRRGTATETPAWRQAIARRLRPRIPIAERLVVASPAYKRFGVRVEVRATVGRQAATIVESVRRELTRRYAVAGRDGQWPQGRHVDATAISGWIRKLEGVAGVISVTLLDQAARPLEGDHIVIGRGEMPQLIEPPEVIVRTDRVRA
jgi:hypothetical protein